MTPLQFLFYGPFWFLAVINLLERLNRAELTMQTQLYDKSLLFFMSLFLIKTIFQKGYQIQIKLYYYVATINSI